VREFALRVDEIRIGRRDDQLKADEKRRLSGMTKAYREALEDHLNAYENACTKYIDGKIDRQRFRQSYVTEIRNLCEQKQGTIHDLLHPESTSRFEAIWKVYKEWHRHEE